MSLIFWALYCTHVCILINVLEGDGLTLKPVDVLIIVVVSPISWSIWY